MRLPKVKTTIIVSSLLAIGAIAYFALPKTVKVQPKENLGAAPGLFTGTASISGNLAFNGEIEPDDTICSNGEILKKTGANDWDCAADNTGAGGGSPSGIELVDSGGTFGTHYGSISFDASHFTSTLGSPTASASLLRLDWGAGGPASLSEAETITGNWVNTANAWADNEVANNLTINGGTVTWTDLTTYPTGCTNQFVTTIGDTLTCATADDAYVNNAITISGGTIGSNNISGTLTTTGTLTIGDNGDSIILDASNWDISTLGKADFLSASVSTNFEATGYASASAFVLPSTAGGTLGDCDAAGDTLNWDVTTRKFVCGSDASGSVASNSLDWDEFVDSMTLDANTTIASGSGANALTIKGTIKEWAGSTTSPSYTFANDTNTGIYQNGADILAITVGGTTVLNATTANVQTGTGIEFRTSGGTASTPGYGFTNDTNTGLYQITTDTLGFAIGGVQRASVSASRWEFNTGASVSGDLWVGGDMSALTITDRTPWVDKKATDLLRGISGNNGKIDYSTLPPELLSVSGEGRDLSKTVSVLIKAIQEQQDQIDVLGTGKLIGGSSQDESTKTDYKLYILAALFGAYVLYNELDKRRIK